jgi:hypothetical protein
MKKLTIAIVAITAVCIAISIVVWLQQKKTVVEGTIEIGLAFDQPNDAPIDFIITGITFVEKTGKRYTIAESKKFKFINKSNEPDGILSLGENGQYKAKGRIMSSANVIKQLEKQRNRRIIEVPEYDVFVTDTLEKIK